MFDERKRSPPDFFERMCLIVCDKMGFQPEKKTLLGLICLFLALFFGWLVLFPFRKLSFLGEYAIYFGKNPVIHVLLLGAFFLYVFLFISKPDLAKNSALNSARTVKDVLVYVLIALFIAGAVVNVYPAGIFSQVIGPHTGVLGVFAGVALGAVLPACPFVSYPIIGGLYAAGAGIQGVMGMLFGSGLGFVCVISADLSFFDSRVMGLRILITFFTALVAGLLVYFFGMPFLGV